MGDCSSSSSEEEDLSIFKGLAVSVTPTNFYERTVKKRKRPFNSLHRSGASEDRDGEGNEMEAGRPGGVDPLARQLDAVLSETLRLCLREQPWEVDSDAARRGTEGAIRLFKGRGAVKHIKFVRDEAIERTCDAADTGKGMSGHERGATSAQGDRKRPKGHPHISRKQLREVVVEGHSILGGGRMVKPTPVRGMQMGTVIAEKERDRGYDCSIYDVGELRSIVSRQPRGQCDRVNALWRFDEDGNAIVIRRAPKSAVGTSNRRERKRNTRRGPPAKRTSPLRAHGQVAQR